MKLGPWEISRTKALPRQSALQPVSASANWLTLVREPYAGAWQANAEISVDSVANNPAIFACTTLIASDIAKLCLRLVEKTGDGIWVETESAAFSPVLRRPNHYQTPQKFIEQWIVSKLMHGNTYVWKERDQRGAVIAMYVLNPIRVVPLVAQDGSIFYELRRDDLSQLPRESVTVPASEIIHDRMVELFHPLVGVSPIFAAGIAALQGLKIQANSVNLFTNGSNPGGVLTAPGAISDDTARRLKAHWDANYQGSNVGKIAVLGDGLEFTPMSVNAVDSQLVEQLKWTDEKVCSCYHVPPYMIGVGPFPPYANIEPMVQQYYSQCLQSLIQNCETALDVGLGLLEKKEGGRQYGVEFDINDLIWLDNGTKTTASSGVVSGSIMTINEARRRYWSLPPVKGGDTIWMQQQDYSVEALMDRDADKPFAKPEPAPPPDEPVEDEDEDGEMMAAFLGALHTKSIEEGLYDA